MGLEFLARVRRTSIWLGLCAALVAASYADPLLGVAVAAGVAWSLVNLFLIEKLVVSTTGSARGTASGLRGAALSLAAMPPLFAVGALLLVRLSPLALVAGFTLPLLVIVLKAVALLVLPSAAWRRLTASPWRATAVVAGLALAAWAAADALTGAHGAAPAAPHAAASEPHGEAAGGHGAAGGHADQGPQKFANVITILSRAFPHASWAQFLHHYEAVIFSLFVALLVVLIARAAMRRPQMVPGRLQNLVEMLVSTLHDFVVGILGPRHGPRYVPFLGTLFLYILVMNVFGLIPFMDSPTSNLNVTVALALVVFVYSQIIGFRELGVVGYFDHMMGTPRTLIGWLLVPLMLPIHLMGELAKPISLACRLFGNIFGEDMLLVAFATLGIAVLSFANLPFGIPLQLPFIFLALLTSTLQALVFTVLSTIYFLLMLPHDDHEHEEAHHPQTTTA